jgi:hypothetical protein
LPYELQPRLSGARLLRKCDAIDIVRCHVTIYRDVYIHQEEGKWHSLEQVQISKCLVQNPGWGAEMGYARYHLIPILTHVRPSLRNKPVSLPL